MPAPVQSEADFQLEIEKAYREFCIEEQRKEPQKQTKAAGTGPPSLRVSKCRLLERDSSEPEEVVKLPLSSLEATHNSRKQVEGVAAKLGLNPPSSKPWGRVRPQKSTFAGVRSRDI